MFAQPVYYGLLLRKPQAYKRTTSSCCVSLWGKQLGKVYICHAAAAKKPCSNLVGLGIPNGTQSLGKATPDPETDVASQHSKGLINYMSASLLFNTEPSSQSDVSEISAAPGRFATKTDSRPPAGGLAAAAAARRRPRG